MYNLLNGLFLLTILTQTLADLDKLNSSQRVAEGGTLPNGSEDRTHLSREHVIEPLNSTTTFPAQKNITDSLPTIETGKKVTLSDKSNATVKPVAEKAAEIDLGVPKKNDEKQSVGKKGVSFSDMDTTVYVSKETVLPNKTTSSPLVVKPKPSTTEAPLPKKPLITEHDDFVSNTAESSKSNVNPKIPNIDTILEKKSKRADYVIPIVAVILSVPLVAIAISFLYKRGTDWWQHRNYRRMDFLIEGMYNN